MKRLFAALLLLTFASYIEAQTTFTSDNLRAKQSVTIAGKYIIGVGDSASSLRRDNYLITEKKAKDYADSTVKNRGVFDIVKDGKAKPDGAEDVAPIIRAAINSGYLKITAPLGYFLFNSTVKLSDSIWIEGAGAGTVFFTTMNAPIFKAGFDYGNYAKITNLTFKGSYTGERTGAGGGTNQDALRSDSTAGVIVTNVTGFNLGGWLVRMKRNGRCCATYVYNATRSSIIQGNRIFDSYGAVYMDTASEYNVISGNIASNCHFSYREKIAANNIVSSNNFSGNHFGFYAVGGGGNVGHSPVTSNSFAHCNVPLYVEDAPVGYFFSNNIFYTDVDSICIKNSSYIRIYGGFMTANGGKIKIDNCTNCSFTDVDDLNGVVSVYQIVGTAPKVFRSWNYVEAQLEVSKLSTRIIDDSYTADSTDHVILVDANTNDISVYLPDPTTCPGKQFIIQRIDNTSIGSITVAPVAGLIVDNDGLKGSTALIPGWGGGKASITIISNGYFWCVLFS